MDMKSSDNWKKKDIYNVVIRKMTFNVFERNGAVILRGVCLSTVYASDSITYIFSDLI